MFVGYLQGYFVHFLNGETRRAAECAMEGERRTCNERQVEILTDTNGRRFDLVWVVCRHTMVSLGR